MPLTPFSGGFGNQTGGGQAGFDPLTGRPNTTNAYRQNGFQMPPPLGGLPMGSPEKAYVDGMQQFAQSQQQPEGFQVPPPPSGPLTYQSGFKTYQLDPNAAYTMGIDGKPKRAQMI